MFALAWLLTGTVLALGLIAGLRRLSPVAEIRLVALGLVAAALVYMLFALRNGDWTWQLLDLFGVVIYGSMAWLGLRHSRQWLAFGWALHPLWDVLIHGLLDDSRIAPAWYVITCVSFDLTLAIYCTLKWRRRPAVSEVGDTIPADPARTTNVSGAP